MLDRVLAGFGVICLVLAIALGVWGWADREGVDAARRVAADRQLDQLRCDRFSPVVTGLEQLAATPDPGAVGQIPLQDTIIVLGFDLQRVVIVTPLELSDEVQTLILELNRSLSGLPADKRLGPPATAASARITAWFERHCPDGPTIGPGMNHTGPDLFPPATSETSVPSVDVPGGAVTPTTALGN